MEQKIVKRVSIALAVVVALLVCIAPFWLLTYNCSLAQKGHDNATIERKEDTKVGEYKTYQDSYAPWKTPYATPYYEHSTSETKKTGQEPSDWGNDFWCGVKFTDVVLADFTVLLTVFTGLLFYSTEKLWRSAKEQSTLIRNEFISSHRPRLIVRRVRLLNEAKDGEKHVVRYVIANTGGTDAAVVEYNATADYLPFGRPPILLPLNLSQDVMEPRFQVRQGAAVEQQTISVTPFKRGGNSGYLYFFGYVRYADDTGNIMTTAFCRIYNYSTSRFVPIEDSDLEYAD